MGTIRYFIYCDDSGHYFIIPENMKNEWNNWRDTISDDIPEYVIQVNGDYTQITFENPKLR